MIRRLRLWWWRVRWADDRQRLWDLFRRYGAARVLDELQVYVHGLAQQSPGYADMEDGIRKVKRSVRVG